MDNATKSYQVLSDTLVRIMKPIVRMLLRNGVTYQAFADTVKTLYVQVAADEFKIPGRKQSDARVSVITGLSRKEVKRVSLLELRADTEHYVRYNRAARVISGWTQDRDFLDRHDTPIDLPLDGPGPSFVELVRRYSGDAPPRAVLDELERVGAVERLQDGRITLLTRAYIPQTDDADKIGVLGLAVGDLLNSIEHNFWGNGGEPYFQRMVSNQALPLTAVPEFRAVSKRKCQQLLESLDQWLTEHEADERKVARADVKRVGVGIYYFED